MNNQPTFTESLQTSDSDQKPAIKADNTKKYIVAAVILVVGLILFSTIIYAYNMTNHAVKSSSSITASQPTYHSPTNSNTSTPLSTSKAAITTTESQTSATSSSKAASAALDNLDNQMTNNSSNESNDYASMNNDVNNANQDSADSTSTKQL